MIRIQLPIQTNSQYNKIATKAKTTTNITIAKSSNMSTTLKIIITTIRILIRTLTLANINNMMISSTKITIMINNIMSKISTIPVNSKLQMVSKHT